MVIHRIANGIAVNDSATGMLDQVSDEDDLWHLTSLSPANELN
jgi:hypothetical protein